MYKRQEKYNGGIVPDLTDAVDAVDEDLKAVAVGAADKVEAEMDKFAFNMALESIWVVVRRANKYIDAVSYTHLNRTREQLLTDLNCCSKKGLTEMFDSTIGAATVLMPLGGRYQLSPAAGMAAKLPVTRGETDTATIMSYGFDPEPVSYTHLDVYKRQVHVILVDGQPVTEDSVTNFRLLENMPVQVTDMTENERVLMYMRVWPDIIVAVSYTHLNLQRAFEKEKRFTSDVSHELRTHLSVIISQSDYALEDEEYRKKSLEVINREAKRMAGRVNRLLTLARSDAGRLRPEREKVDMSDMCETVAWQQEGIAAEKGIAIETQIEEGVFVYGDETMLIRVILNLMDNAIKYGKKNGHVKLKLRIDNGQVCCEVEDDGIGIGPEDMPRIWERFYRVEGSRSEEGSGLGLAMVEAMRCV